MSQDSFAHLHVHTEYSTLDGAARLKPLMEEAVRLGMPAIAMTDHGNLLGAYDFVKEATRCRYQADRGHGGLRRCRGKGSSHSQGRGLFGQGGSDDVSARGAYTHMTMLGDRPGRPCTVSCGCLPAHLWTGCYKKPRVDRELLTLHGKGIIGDHRLPVRGGSDRTCGSGKYDQAVAAADEFRDIFDDGHFFVELMDHDLDIERGSPRGSCCGSRRTSNLPLVATNDLPLRKPGGRQGRQEHLLCINSGSTMDIPAGDGPGQRFAFSGDGYYVKVGAGDAEVFRGTSRGVRQHVAVADMVDATDIASAFKPRDLMPRFPAPAGKTEAELFEELVWEGMAIRYPDGVTDEARERAEFEIGVINSMGFPGYFLVVADFIGWAKGQKIRVGPGRGSGAGSIVAYAMRITDLCPLRHGLLFERFLNPDRVSMPDFDIDFDEKRRTEVIDYVVEKYGNEYVAQIVTLGRIKAKQAIKDCLSDLGYPFSMGDRMTKAYPPAIMGKNVPLADVFDKTAKRYDEAAGFRALVQGDPDAKKVFDVASGVEGLIRSTGVHAAGVIMSSVPLTDVIPVMKREADGAIITQWEYPTCEDLGMVKMDFLGLSNLTTIDEALRNIEREPWVSRST